METERRSTDVAHDLAHDDGAHDAGAAGAAHANEETRDRILEAAADCFLQLGVAKTRIHDVARAAGTSRGTVYRYFADRQELLDEVVERITRKYYQDAERAMRAEATLTGQVGACGETFARHVSRMRRARPGEPEALSLRLLARDLDGARARMAEFLEPYVRAAIERGELPPSADERDAAELLARMLMTLSIMPASSNFDLRRPASVRAFVEQFALHGLGPQSKYSPPFASST